MPGYIFSIQLKSLISNANWRFKMTHLEKNDKSYRYGHLHDK